VLEFLAIPIRQEKEIKGIFREKEGNISNLQRILS
jgi:hypothetical protein